MNRAFIHVIAWVLFATPALGSPFPLIGLLHVSNDDTYLFLLDEKKGLLGPPEIIIEKFVRSRWGEMVLVSREGTTMAARQYRLRNFRLRRVEVIINRGRQVGGVPPNPDFWPDKNIIKGIQAIDGYEVMHPGLPAGHGISIYLVRDYASGETYTGTLLYRDDFIARAVQNMDLPVPLPCQASLRP